MIARLVLVTACLGVLGGAVGTASAGSNDSRHGVCIGMTSDPNSPNRDAICVDLFPGAAQDAR